MPATKAQATTDTYLQNKDTVFDTGNTVSFAIGALTISSP